MIVPAVRPASVPVRGPFSWRRENDRRGRQVDFPFSPSGENGWITDKYRHFQIILLKSTKRSKQAKEQNINHFHRLVEMIKSYPAVSLSPSKRGVSGLTIPVLRSRRSWVRISSGVPFLSSKWGREVKFMISFFCVEKAEFPPQICENFAKTVWGWHLRSWSSSHRETSEIIRHVKNSRDFINHLSIFLKNGITSVILILIAIWLEICRSNLKREINNHSDKF